MKVDIAIMTIREDEFRAVRRYFQTERRRIPDGRTYLIGEAKTEKQTYTIAIARCSEQGTDASQRLAHYIIHNLDPRLILVVGIAGGVPRDEFTLGDVVVSTRIVNLNVDAWYPDGTTDYTTRGGPPHPLVEDIVSLLPGEPLLGGWTNTIQLEQPTLNPGQENITGDDEWREKVRQSLTWHFGEEQNRGRTPAFTIGPILSSNHLMKDPARLREILKIHRSILAVEMEVAGVYEAAQGIDHQYPIIAIRGISDIIGLQRDHRWTEYACQAAAAFTYAFIRSDPLDLPLNAANFQRPVVPSELRERYANTSFEVEESQLPIDTAISPQNNDISEGNKSQQTDENVDFTSTVNHTSKQHRHISRRAALLVIGGAIGLTIVGSVASLAISHSSSDHTAAPTPRSPSLGTTLYTYRGHTAGMNALAWSPNGKRIATASDDYTAQVWDATTGKHAVIYRGHSSYVKGVAWAPHGEQIVSGSADGTAHIWNANTGQTIFTYNGHVNFYRRNPSAQGHPWVNRVSWSPDGTKIASCDQFSIPGHIASVQVWDAVAGKTITTYHGHTDGVYAIAWSLDGNRIASAGYDGTLQIWEAATGNLLASYQGSASLFGLCWSPDSKYIAVGTSDNTVLIVGTSNGNISAIYNGHFNWVKDVAWSPSGKYIASGSDDALVILWNTANGENIYTFNGHSSHINAVGWSPSGKLIASGGLRVQVWEAL